VAGEASGDQYGAALVHALFAYFPRLYVYGVGGAQMRAAGVQTVFDVERLNAVGVVEICAKIPSAMHMAHRLLQEAATRGTRVVVLIDAPVFNLYLAQRAKRAGLHVIYYVSPQIWAWWPSRVKTMARCIDVMLTLFPFEVPLYTAAGVEAVYVGHPVVDRVQALPTAVQAARMLGLEVTRPIIALLPGSRRQELRRLLVPMLVALRHIRQRLPQIQGILPVAPTVARQEVQRFLSHCPVPVTVVQGQSTIALRAAQVALVASGTATLEAGLIGIPMVVVYKVHAVTALLARRLLRISSVGLVNIVAGKAIVPELLQQHVRPRMMAALALKYLEHDEETQRVKRELARLHEILGPGGSAQRAAAYVGRSLTTTAGIATGSRR
jgi:lipid-A-disaccharide synthase